MEPKELLAWGKEISRKLDALLEKARLPEEEVADLRRWQAERAERERDRKVFLERTRTLGDMHEVYEQARREREEKALRRQQAVLKEIQRRTRNS